MPTQDAVMQDTPARAAKHLFIILNPVAGTHDPNTVRDAFERHFADNDIPYDLYETTGRESVGAIANDARKHGYHTVVAAGGDGTVSEVAGGLLSSDTPLGILPIGTANVLAQELNIPLTLDEACKVLATTPDHHTIRTIDAMCIAEHVAVLHIGIGLNSITMRDTRREDKRRFGRFAYLYTTMRRLLGFQPRRFSLSIDGKKYRYQAAQIQVANGGALGGSAFKWWPDICPDDGQVDVFVVNARHLVDYLMVAWHIATGQQKRSRRMRHFAAKEKIIIHADKPLPVHVDGDVIGETPAEIHISPRAVRIVVPGA